MALLRGIMPTNPNMRGEKLREVFSGLGFTQVQTVIASGNVIFDSASKSPAALENKIETALFETLGFKSTTMVRSRAEIQKLINKNLFKNIKDEKPNYLLVTFFKDRREEQCDVIDISGDKTPHFMSALERTHGKALTTRTWKTVHRIQKKME